MEEEIGSGPGLREPSRPSKSTKSPVPLSSEGDVTQGESLKNPGEIQAWWPTIVISALERLRQEGCYESESSLGYTVSSRRV